MLDFHQSYDRSENQAETSQHTGVHRRRYSRLNNPAIMCQAPDVTTSAFVGISPSIWQLDDEHAHRAYPPYTQIVQWIAQEAEITDHRRNEARNSPGFFRAIITLRCRPEIVSMFHNAPTGYRAQYYSSASRGERANAFAMRLLADLVLKLLAGCSKKTCPLWFVERSLLEESAKVWIHQGTWLRSPRATDRNLHVARWTEAQWSADKRHRKLARWSELTALGEDRIDLLGGFFSLSTGMSLGSLKATRSRELQDLGYT